MIKKRGKILKAGDYIVIVLIFGLVTLLFYQYLFSKPYGRTVLITGKSFQGSFPLLQKRVVEVEGPLGITKVIIDNEEVWIEESPCREKICIKMGRIKRVGEQVVCIPNRVIVEVIGESSVIDGVTR